MQDSIGRADIEILDSKLFLNSSNSAYMYVYTKCCEVIVGIFQIWISKEIFAEKTHLVNLHTTNKKCFVQAFYMWHGK
jgi:hypothetical protein